MSQWDDESGGMTLVWGRNAAGSELVLPLQGSAVLTTMSITESILGGVVHTAETVGTAGSAILATNTQRVFSLFVNDSDTHDVYLNVAGGSAAPNTGIRLNAGGGSYQSDPTNGNLWQGVVSAAAGSAGSALVLVTEGQRA